MEKFLDEHNEDTGKHSLKHSQKGKISIVLPTYNRANMLPKCIENILNQTYENIELIIVNDCSTDTTNSVLLNYLSNPRIIIVTHDKNQGTPGALNSGFKKATGDYLTWTSDDNFLYPEFCSTFLETFIKKPEIDYLYCDYMIFENDEDINIKDIHDINKKNIVIKPFYPNKLDFLISFRGAAGFMWTRKVYEKVGDFDTSLYGIEDLDYLLRIIFNNFAYDKVDQTLFYYRVHKGNITYKLKNIPKKFGQLNEALTMSFLKNFPEFSTAKGIRNQIKRDGQNKGIVKCLLRLLA